MRWIHPDSRPPRPPVPPARPTRRALRRDKKTREAALRQFGKLIARGLAAGKS